MKQAFILIGPSGSGKSTVRRKLEEKYEGAVAFSLDDCRVKCYLDESADHGKTMKTSEGDMYRKAFDFCNKRKKTFEDFTSKNWKSTLAAETVIVDNTNSTRKARGTWVRDLQARGFHITMVVVNTPLETIIARQKTRGDKEVPADVVKSQFMRQEEPMVGSECDAIMIIDGTKEITL